MSLLYIFWKWLDTNRSDDFFKGCRNLSIHFDTSNQIEVNKGKGRIGNYYLQGIEDLKRVLVNLK